MVDDKAKSDTRPTPPPPSASGKRPWQIGQRAIITNTIDYSLEFIARLVDDGTINVSPHHQRRERWDEKRRSKLIESFLMNVPVPPVFLNEDEVGELSVIDGKQRLLAVKSFFLNELRLQGLEVLGELNGMTFEHLPKQVRAFLVTRPTIRAIIILRQSPSDVKHEVFHRLNYGVILNAQEMRNNAFPGPLNNLVMELSVHPLLHELLLVKKRATSRIYLEMKDAEYVLRYLAYRNQWQDYSGDLGRGLDQYMEEHKYMGDDDIDGARSSFTNTIQCVHAFFGECAFRRWVYEKGFWRRQVMAALFDAQMFASQNRSPSATAFQRKRILNGLRALFKDNDFRESIDAATNTASYFKRRINMVAGLLDSVLS